MTGEIIRREERAQMNTGGRWSHDNEAEIGIEVARQGMPRIA